ncbi:MAG: hypothetical protein IPH18_18075 [Chitinophagaceae bacterium]|nr:hypothetical protein [Chitinophagaceae bacterium]
MPVGQVSPGMACVPGWSYSIAGTITTWYAGRRRNCSLINGLQVVSRFTVQIAKAYGARVTGVCSGENADFIKSIGADQVTAFDKEIFISSVKS